MDDNKAKTNAVGTDRTVPSFLHDMPKSVLDYNDDTIMANAVQYDAVQQLDSMTLCPNCGAMMSQGADYCESCHHYINYNACSFCGAELQGNEAYCPECGNPKGGIACPRCNTMNDFAFCKQCGMPLTHEARQLLLQVKNTPEYKHMQMLADKLSDLDKVVPMTSEVEVEHEEANNALRLRVLKLLAEDRGESVDDIKDVPSKRMTEQKLKESKQQLANQLVEALELMQTKPTEKPVEARNYAMAMKPAGLRLAWKCNYKNAIHSSPCGCAKPQMGGKWIILGHTSNSKIVDDNG